jgi:Kef-type K+ transport system membrane component KefB
MNELSSLGLILLLALLAGHLVQFLRIPEVTGYILAGVALGPSVLGWVSAENLTALEVLSEVALGLILFSIGSVFEFERFRPVGRRIAQMTLMESLPAALLVFLGILLLGQPWQAAALLGATAIGTAPASTLMVMRESDASGPLSETLLGIMAVNNIFCLIVFSLVAALIEVTAGVGGVGVFDTLYRSAFGLVWQLAGSAALGVLVGLMLAGWATKVHEGGEMLILLAGSILLCVGAARILDLSPLVASLGVGATMVNLSRRSRRLFDALSGTHPPFYAVFFVIAGADLDVTLVPTMGVLGVFYVIARSAGKFFGARWGAGRLGMPEAVRRYLGYGLLAQAGLAVGLTLVINRRFPDFAPAITVVVLASVVIHEMLGPIGTRFAIVRAGEAHHRKAEPESIWA